MRRLTWLVTLVTLTGATTETTDFDVYNPMRTLHYLVKTTMPGGGNFANKLAPGYVYVWNGIKPRCALKDMMDSLIYKEDKFKTHVGKEKDPKPIITTSRDNPRGLQVLPNCPEGWDTCPKLDETLNYPLGVDTKEQQEAVRNHIILRLRTGKDLCNYFTSDDESMQPVDDVARVHLQSRIDAHTLMNPAKHLEYLKKNKKFNAKQLPDQFPWFMDMVNNIKDKKKIRVHPSLAKAYSFRHYVDRDCDNLLYLMPSYIDCIDGRLAETIIDDKGKVKKGVKYAGDAPISQRYRGLHKMTRLKKEPFYMVADSYHLNKAVKDDFGEKPYIETNEYKGKPYAKKMSISEGRTFYWHNRTTSYYDAHDRLEQKHPSRTGKSFSTHGGRSLLEMVMKPGILGFRGREVGGRDGDWTDWGKNGAANFYKRPAFYTELLRFQGVKTPILSPVFQGHIWNWKASQDAMSSTLNPVRDWSPRNVKTATGALNPYWNGHKVNKNLYPVINMNGRPFWRSHATDSLYVSQAAFNWRLKALGHMEHAPFDLLGRMERRNQGRPEALESIKGISTNRKVPKTNGSPDWVDRTSSGKKFTYAYSAGCWMKMAPENYGYDIPKANSTDVDADKWKIYSQQHKDRAAKGLEPKYKYNEAMQRWWKGDYGEQWYFSLKDAITQKRCNGDEMLWYLFYSRPSKMDEFCTNTNFGNKIPNDFCKLNPPAYFNFTITHKNNRNVENRGKPFSYRPEWHKEKFGNDFIFTGFASKNNPDVWMTAADRKADFNQWCEDSGRDCGETLIKNLQPFYLLLRPYTCF